MNGALAGFSALVAVIGVLVFTARGHVSAAPKENGHASKKVVFERVAAGIFAVAAFGGVLAFAPQLAALWQVTGTGWGLWILGALLLVTGFFGFLMVFKGSGHHHHGSVAVAAVFGITVALAIGGWPEIRSSLGKSAASAGQGASGVVSGSAMAGTGAHHQAIAAASTSGGRWVIVIAVVVLAIALIVFLRGYRKSTASEPGNGKPQRRGGGSGASRNGNAGKTAALTPAGPAIRPGGPAVVAGDAR